LITLTVSLPLMGRRRFQQGRSGDHPGGLDGQYAHKISLVHNAANDTFYLYYCAVGKAGDARKQGALHWLVDQSEAVVGAEVTLEARKKWGDTT